MIKGLYTAPLGGDIIRGIADTLVHATQGDMDTLRQYTILLPTRRSIRALEEQLLHSFNAPTVLLPTLMAIGDIEIPSEDHDVTIPPPRAMNGIERICDIMPFLEQNGYQTASFNAQWRLAQDVLRIIDLLETEGLTPESLDKLAPETMAEHWQKNTGFFQRVARDWLDHLAHDSRINMAADRNHRIHRMIDQWHDNPPDHPIWLVGSTGSIPAVRQLMRTILKQENGAILLPGLDTLLDDVSWNAINDAHPQSLLRKTITMLGYDRRAIQNWPHISVSDTIHDRAHMISSALSPFIPSYSPRCDQNISVIDASNAEEELLAISLTCARLLHANPQEKIIIIANDPMVQERLSPLLSIRGIHLDSSTGVRIATQRFGMTLYNLMAILHDTGAISDLWSMLKNPLFNISVPHDDLCNIISSIEEKYLRSALLCPEEIEDAILLLPSSITASLNASRRQCQMPRTMKDWALWWQKTIADHITPRTHEDRLCVDAILQSLDDIGVITSPRLVNKEDAFFILSDLLSRATYRDDTKSHPSISLLGTMEARLMQADTMILTGLNEGNWPDTPRPSPFLSRAMRHAVGLPDSERHAALSGHDFQQAFLAPRVIITRAIRTQDGPTLPARWLQRLRASLPPAIWSSYEARGHQILQDVRYQFTTNIIEPITPPQPLATWPHMTEPLSVTSIELWRHDPFSFWAKHILKLRALNPFMPEISAADRGSIWHDFFKVWTTGFNVHDNHNAQNAHYEDSVSDILNRYDLPKHRQRLWRARLMGMANTMIYAEIVRRKDASLLSTEQEYRSDIGGYIIRARADRVDQNNAGELVVCDYKTGSSPSIKSVEAGMHCQLSLLALILSAPVTKLDYLEIKGGRNPIKVTTIPWSDMMAQETRDGFAAWCALFLTHNHPFVCLADYGAAYRDKAQDYLHLARHQEWGGRS